MSYFPTDIPFMSEEELKENGIKIPKDTKRPDLYIYKLDLNAEKPVIEKFPAKIREGAYGDEVVRWVGPNNWDVWHSEFDTRMLGVVYEPLDNVVELIVKRDAMFNAEALMLIQSYCHEKAVGFREKLDMFNRGVGAVTEVYVRDSWNLY